MMKIFENKSLKTAKRIIVAVIGFTVLIVGVAMILLPGPAFIVIPLGLAILATEFLWAGKLLKRIKNTLRRQKKEGKHDSETE
jgi:tellurite resistance protein TerC